MAKELTIRQEKFVAAYLVSTNATRAAIEAGYSAKSAAPQGHQLLNNPKVKSMLAIKSGELLDRYNVSAERVLEELGKIAFVDPRKFFNADGGPKELIDLDGDSAAAVSAFEVVELFNGSKGDQKHVIGLVKKVKLADKLKALELLARYHKLLTDRVEDSGPTLEQLICGASSGRVK